MKFTIVGLDAISYEDSDDLEERLKSFPGNTKVITKGDGWADLEWSDTFEADSEEEAKSKASEYEANAWSVESEDGSITFTEEDV